MERNTLIAIVVVVLVLGGLYAYTHQPVTITPGSVDASGAININGNSTAVNTGTMSFYQGTTLQGTHAVAAGAYTVNLNPGDYIACFDATGYYSSVWAVNIPQAAAQTGKYNLGGHGVYPVATLYSISFANESYTLATMTQAAQSDQAWKEAHVVHSYTLTVSCNSPYSSFGLPGGLLNYPGRDAVGNYLILTFNTANVVCSTVTDPTGVVTTSAGRSFILPWDNAVSLQSSGSTAKGISLEFTAAGSYTCEAYLGTYTNMAQMIKYLLPTAPCGFTVGSYHFGTAVAITIS